MGKTNSQDDVAASVFGSDRERDEAPADESVRKPGEGEARVPADDNRADDDDRRDDQGEGDEGGEDENQEGFVPLREHIRERKKFQTSLEGINAQLAELTRVAQAKDLELAELRGRVTATPQRQQQQRRMAPPDPRRDPAGAALYEVQRLRAENTNIRLNTSEHYARKTHGTKVVDEAIAAAKQANIFYEFANATDPYDELVTWHKEQQSFSRLNGKSLEDFEKEIRADEKAKLEKANKPQLPGSLASSTRSGGGDQGGHQSQAAVAKTVFGSDRSRKRA